MRRLICTFMVLFVAGCALPEPVPEISLSQEEEQLANKIQVSTMSSTYRPYKVLGQVSTEVSHLGPINYNEANRAIRAKAFKQYGNSVDVILGVVYSEKKEFFLTIDMEHKLPARQFNIRIE